jgi:hypothetical protein
MLRLPIIELFLRLIPEGILYVFAMYAFSGKKINILNLFLYGVLLGVIGYLIRLLPIHFGVHTILFLMIYIFASVKVIQVEVFNAIAYSLIMVIILFISELINIYVGINLLNISTDIFFGNSLLKILYGLPSLILAFLVIFFIYYINHYKNKKVED